MTPRLVDVTVETFIAAPPAAVAAIMFDPDHDPRWIGGVRLARRLGAGPLAVGGRVRREGGLPFRRFAWTTEATAHVPARELSMRFLDGPIEGEAAYVLEPKESGTRTILRVRGALRMFFPFAAAIVAASMRADLARLKRLVETNAETPS